MSLPRDLVELLLAFGDAKVRYLVIGGHAVSLHARPRSTKDLDIWLDANRENIEHACQALQAFGVPKELIDQLRMARRDEIVWMGRVPARIDLLQSLVGVDFNAAWQRRVVTTIDTVRVNFIAREDLIANKKAVGRPQDLRDVRALERAAASERKAMTARRTTSKKTRARK
jgi:hypothetical protein